MAITPTHRGTQDVASASSIVVASVAGTLGNMLMLAVEVFDPFSSQTVTGVSSSHGTWTRVAGGIGTEGGTARPWRNSEWWSCPVGTTHTGSVTVSFSGTADDATGKVVEITGHDTGSPFGADFNVVAAGSTADHVTTGSSMAITLSGASAGDLLLISGNGDQSGADHWVQPKSGTTLLHTSATQPNSGGTFASAYGYIEATGSTVTGGLEWWTNDGSPFLHNFAEPIGSAILIKQASGGGGASIVPILNTRKFFGA